MPENVTSVLERLAQALESMASQIGTATALVTRHPDAERIEFAVLAGAIRQAGRDISEGCRPALAALAAACDAVRADERRRILAEQAAERAALAKTQPLLSLVAEA